MTINQGLPLTAPLVNVIQQASTTEGLHSQHPLQMLHKLLYLRDCTDNYTNSCTHSCTHQAVSPLPYAFTTPMSALTATLTKQHCRCTHDYTASLTAAFTAILAASLTAALTKQYRHCSHNYTASPSCIHSYFCSITHICTHQAMLPLPCSYAAPSNPLP